MGPASRARRCTVYPDGNVRVGKRLEVDRVELWDAKGDPEHDGDCDWVQAFAKAEGYSN